MTETQRAHAPGHRFVGRWDARKASAVIVMGGLVGLLAGAALGVVWWRLAPRVTMVVRPGEGTSASLVHDGFQPQGYISADVAFAALAVAAGVFVTIGLIRMRREHLTSALFASLLAGLLGSLVMWFVGTHLGDVDIDGLAATTDVESTVDAPLRITMPAVLLLWPIAAALVATVVSMADWLHARRWLH